MMTSAVTRVVGVAASWHRPGGACAANDDDRRGGRRRAGREPQRNAGARRENGSSDGDGVAGLGLEAAAGGAGAGCRMVAPGLVGCIGVASIAACEAASRGAPATITDGGFPGSMPRYEM